MLGHKWINFNPFPIDNKLHIKGTPPIDTGLDITGPEHKTDTLFFVIDSNLYNTV